eukprot:NODE_9174_length_1442_cov_3.341445.p1 GENE.NODE_9174_length_1442_cov_3.341445~~NODE_9174_length_1442_cov_3.341445.p1  ORF type:complete len:312 (-),score=77.67 NODE_9174_length_1442_cov_3.341445:158-1093(-)
MWNGFLAAERHYNRSLIFVADLNCYPPKDDHGRPICNEGYPKSPSKWRYLNSGLIAGRGHAVRQMLRDPVPDVIKGGDQAWFQRYFLEHQDVVGLDVECLLFQCAFLVGRVAAAMGAGGGEDQDLELEGGRILNRVLNTTPALVHFNGPSHWPRWTKDWLPTTYLHEVFKELYPEVEREVFPSLDLRVEDGSVHYFKMSGDIISPNGGGARILRGLMCLSCRTLRLPLSECGNFPSVFQEPCIGDFLLPLLALLVLLCCLPLALWSRRRGVRLVDCVPPRFLPRVLACWKAVDVRTAPDPASGAEDTRKVV